ncbi:BTB/POZ domain-containing protein At5g03250-like [Abrus precatorius]|uniref:BTB/POZ domain-containing protein At5g03250-like n=1 Tax=Abrus precatorius TaxID=3816 RepID=A0A8B8MFY8_ABRPR|nr:BTB/POZ domain-containing protein At5g03250-like [Abrus precatorius]
MAFMRLGSKSDAFHREGQTWHCTTGLPSDVIVEIGETSFCLHKFPLLSRSGLLKKLIADFSNEEGSSCVLQLDDVPGGDKTFELVTKFCYGVKIEVTASNVVSLRCAAEYLQMNENYGEGNLISRTEAFLNEVFSNWLDSIKALQTCEEVKPYAEELHIVSRCIDSLTMKVCSDTNMFNRPVAGHDCSQNPTIWNGISSETKSPPSGDEWWYEDLSLLSLPLYKRLILSIEAKGMKTENVAASLVYYIRKFVPFMNRQSSFNDKNSVNPGTTTNAISEADQRALLEEIMGLLPNKKGVTPSKYLLRLLRTAMILHASASCIENLEKRIGLQLDQAELVDLLIPNMGYSVETLYDIDCIQRIIDHFISIYQPATASTSPCITEEGPLMPGADALSPMTMVANLIDSYLAEVALDVNLKLPKFQALASAIPDYARPLEDDLYHAIDVYLKAHPWLIDSEREQFCRLMNCQKLSLEASTHAAQNERLPLRVIVQVLFFEQLRLRTSISSWLFVSEGLENSHNPSGNLGLPRNDGTSQLHSTEGAENLRDRVSELEKECSCIRKDLQKLAKAKKSWSLFPRIFFRKKA